MSMMRNYKATAYRAAMTVLALPTLAAFSCQSHQTYAGDGTYSRHPWYYQRPHTIRFDDIALNESAVYRWTVRHPPSDKMYLELMGKGDRVGPRAESTGACVTATWKDEAGRDIYECGGLLYKNIEPKPAASCWVVGGNETDFAVWSVPPFPIEFENAATYTLVVRVDVEEGGSDPIVVSPRLHSLPR